MTFIQPQLQGHPQGCSRVSRDSDNDRGGSVSCATHLSTRALFFSSLSLFLAKCNL